MSPILRVRVSRKPFLTAEKLVFIADSDAAGVIVTAVAGQRLLVKRSVSLAFGDFNQLAISVMLTRQGKHVLIARNDDAARFIQDAKDVIALDTFESTSKPIPFFGVIAYTLEEWAISRRTAAILSVCLVFRPDVMPEVASVPASEEQIMSWEFRKQPFGVLNEIE